MVLRLPDLHEPKRRPVLQLPPRNTRPARRHGHDVKLQRLTGQGEALVQLKDAVSDVRSKV
jgi:hypothetical protein